MASLELERLCGRTSVVHGPANIGAYEVGEGRVILIDSGNDEDAGRKILRACESSGLTISHILNTHSHADHCGGNAFIQARSSCRIAATRAEAAFIETPFLEPSYLWSGYPLPALRNKFLVAKPSKVTDLIVPPCLVADTEIEAIPLPGHFLDMAGFMTPDRVFFAADSVASVEILEKYHIFFLYDIGAQLESLEALLEVDAEWFVPSHAEPTRDIAPLVAANKAKIEEISAFLLASCRKPASPEELLARLAGRYGIELNHQQYVLVGATLRSYLSWLADRRLVSSRIDDGRLLFATMEEG